MKSMNFRSATFWGRDTLFGGRVRAELRDVEFLNNQSVEATKRRLKLLEQHLNYVTSRVPYYKNLENASSLTDFPILNKEEIRSKQTRMLADNFDVSELHVATTSGSTGTPFKLYQDKRKRRRANAESMHLGSLAGYQIGAPLWYLKIWTERTSYSHLGAFARNMRQIDVSKFNEQDALNVLTEAHQQNKRISIIAHSSVLETMARALQHTKRDDVGSGKIAALIGQAEPLSEHAREILWERTGVFPVARYGMQELGLLGQQAPTNDKTYMLNLASHIVEVLEIDSDDRASVGEIGRVVVTDLFNKAQPLVRYDTGDLAVVGRNEPQTGFIESLETLEGRSRDRLYDVDDKPISPLVSYNFWWKFPGILQYQIIQQNRGQYVLKLHVNADFEHEVELVEELKKVVGHAACVGIEYGEENFRHASGKRQAIVSEYVPRNYQN